MDSVYMKSDEVLSERFDRDLKRRRKALLRLKENESRSSPIIRSQRRHRTSSTDSDPANSYRNDAFDSYYQLGKNLQYLPQHWMVSSLPNSTSVSQPSMFPLGQHSTASRQHIKTEMIDLMMLQNSQLHQLMTQQMALSYLSPESSSPAIASPKKQKSIHLDDLLLYMKRKISTSDNNGYPPYRLPPIYVPTMLLYQSQPLKPPIGRSRRISYPPAPVYKPKTIKQRRIPGSKAQKRFRRVALAVYFTAALERSRRIGTPRKAPQLNEKFLFGIRLRESISAMHNRWLTPENRISKLLKRVLEDKARNFSAIFRASADEKELSDVYKELAVILENTIYEITETMPTKGVLGTNGKSTLFRIIQPGQQYPRGYFWQIEKDLMKIDIMESFDKITDSDASILLTGIFLGRGIVTSLMLKPKEFHVLPSSTTVTRRAEQNLRILASLFLYILRKFYSSVKAEAVLVAIPGECKELLHSDQDMMNAVKALRKSIDYAQQLLTDWSAEYTRRLRRIL